MDITEYLAHLDPSQRAALKRIHEIVKQRVPDAEETFSYGMPAFKYKGKPLVYYGAFKNHMSLFPTTKPTEELQDRLQEFKVSKGTIQFTIEHPIPTELLMDIISIRLRDISSN